MTRDDEKQRDKSVPLTPLGTDTLGKPDMILSLQRADHVVAHLLLRTPFVMLDDMLWESSGVLVRIV